MLCQIGLQRTPSHPQLPQVISDEMQRNPQRSSPQHSLKFISLGCLANIICMLISLQFTCLSPLVYMFVKFQAETSNNFFLIACTSLQSFATTAICSLAYTQLYQAEQVRLYCYNKQTPSLSGLRQQNLFFTHAMTQGPKDSAHSKHSGTLTD